MASASALKSTIIGQLTQDPQLPRPHPTASLWQAPGTSAIAAVQSAALPTHVDCALIGSGIAALGVARALLTHAPDKTVAILEARTVCSGATGRNGGQLTRLPPTRHTYMAEHVGMDQANKVMRLTVQGLEAVHAATAALGPAFQQHTQVRRLEKFFAYFDEQAWQETQAALALYEAQVPEDKGAYQLVSKEEVAEKYHLPGAYGGLRLAAGTVSPYRLVTGTFAALLQAHAGRFTIDANTPVTAITHTASSEAYPYALTTPRGTVQAAHVVHLTNGHAGHLLPGLRGKMYPRRGHMSVQHPGPAFPPQSDKQSWSFYFDPAHDRTTDAIETGRYYALQNADTGDLWIGGDKDGIDGFITSDDSATDPHADANLRTMLPRLFSADWVTPQPEVKGLWSGIMCYTGDQLPLVGRLPSGTAITDGRAGQGEWIAAGWNTYGMTNGLICGDALGRMMLGQAVDAWFPEAYLPTEKRLNGRMFELNAVLRDYFCRIGAHDVVSKL